MFPSNVMDSLDNQNIYIIRVSMAADPLWGRWWLERF